MMKKANENLAQIKRTVSQVKILSERAYTINKKQYDVYHQQPYHTHEAALHTFGKNEGEGRQSQRQQLLQHLTQTLYAVAYCQMPQQTLKQAWQQPKDNTHFLQQLSASNHSSTDLDLGWTVYSVDKNKNAFVEKNEEIRYLPPKSFRFANPANTQLTVGAQVHLLRQKESSNTQPSFYYVFGNFTVPQEADIVRFYWNLKPEGMHLLIAQLTTLLNQYKIPFSFKCLNHPDYYTRADNAVLYVGKKSASVVNLLLPQVFDKIADYFNENVPLFTKKIRGGVAFAEDPGNNESFGMHRSRLLAKGLLQAHEQGWKKADKILSVVLDTIKEAGLDPAKMYLNPHSHFFYNFSPIYSQ